MHLPFPPPLAPMLSAAADALPSGDGWLFEPKWDGFRTLVVRDGDELMLQSRDEKPMTRYFPELVAPLLAALPQRCVVDGEVVILDMVQGVYFGLNATGAYVWQLVQSPRTVGQLVDALLDEFDVSPDRCRREVDELLGEFINKGLVAIAEY